MNIAIIPARQGSKRVKNKNIKIFKKRPMIFWTIKAAKNSNLFTKIFVDTDSKKIAKYAIKYGAQVPFLRAKSLSKDNISVNKSTYRFVLNLRKQNLINQSKDINIFQLMPNCPFRNSNDIKKLFYIFNKRKTNFLISHHNLIFGNPWWSVIVKKNKIRKFFKFAYKKRSQDLPNVYVPSGAIWIAKIKPFMVTKTFYGKDYTLGKLNWKNSIDIDTLEEFNIANNL